MKKRPKGIRNKVKGKRVAKGNGKRKRGSTGKGKRGEKGIGKKNKKNEKIIKNKIANLTIETEEIRDYRWAMNQKRKALRVQGWFRVLRKKVDKSRLFFTEAAKFFKDCPENLPVYQHLR